MRGLPYDFSLLHSWHRRSKPNLARNHWVAKSNVQANWSCNGNTYLVRVWLNTVWIQHRHRHNRTAHHALHSGVGALCCCQRYTQLCGGSGKQPWRDMAEWNCRRSITVDNGYQTTQFYTPSLLCMVSRDNTHSGRMGQLRVPSQRCICARRTLQLTTASRQYDDRPPGRKSRNSGLQAGNDRWKDNGRTILNFHWNFQWNWLDIARDVTGNCPCRLWAGSVL